MISLICRTVVGAMLFAQTSIVVSACVLPEARPTMAFENDHHYHKPVNPNQCLHQCTAVDQTAQHAEVAVPVASLTGVLALPHFDVRGVARRLRDTLIEADAGPPPPIRFCSLLL
jgi:hypothetical protein